MNGMQMLFKQLGIDPEQVMKDIAVLKATFESVNQKLDSIEKKLDSLSMLRLQGDKCDGNYTGANSTASGECR